MLSAMFRRASWIVSVFVMALTLPVCPGQSHPSPVIEPSGPARPANADGIYLALRGASPAGEGVHVKVFSLDRQGGKFHFDEGTFYFYGPVNGRVTGAVFSGKGHFELA